MWRYRWWAVDTQLLEKQRQLRWREPMRTGRFGDVDETAWAARTVCAHLDEEVALSEQHRPAIPFVDVLTRPHERADARPPQPELLAELARERLFVRFAGLDSSAGQSKLAVLEREEEDRSVWADHDATRDLPRLHHHTMTADGALPHAKRRGAVGGYRAPR